jgi:prepilin-type N-terminal cleavage/methylation domain-containing protein
MRNPYHTKSPACQSGGFTLVELLVVIGIIAILAGVALGPITNGIKKAQESGAMQTTRTLALAEFQYANDNSGSYPDGGGGNCTNLGQALLGGNYISDPTIFVITADKGATKALTSAAFNNKNSSYDFMGGNGTGVSSSAPDQLPLVWSEARTDSQCAITATTPSSARRPRRLRLGQILPRTS